MNFMAGLLLLLLGLAQLAFGIYLFYALLPLWYGIFGMYVGLATGQALFGAESGLATGMTWFIAILLAGLFAFGSYKFEPFRRLVVGGVIGMTIGLMSASALGLTGVFAFLMAILGALVFAVLVLITYDPIIVLGSSLSGAAFTLDGLYMITTLETFNRYSGQFMTIALWIGLSILGIIWQLGPIKRMAESSQGYVQTSIRPA